MTQSNSDNVDIPIEGIVGLLFDQLKGKNTPHWLCMSEEAKDRYIQKGKDIVKIFIENEMELKKQRDEYETMASRS